MHEHDQPDLDNDLLKQFGYESRDVGADKKWFGYAFAFFAFGGVAVVISWGFIALVDRTQAVRPEGDALYKRENAPGAGVPLLQSDVTASKDIVNLRQEEDAKINHKHYTFDPDHPLAIPVDEAERIILKRGLPTRANPVEPEEAKQ